MSASPFTMTIPTHSLEESHLFYTRTIGCKEIARGPSHIQYQFYHHRLIVCFIDAAFTPQEHCNHVDKFDVPVPHFGIVLSEA